MFTNKNKIMYALLFTGISISLILICIILLCVYAYVQSYINKIEKTLAVSSQQQSQGNNPLEIYPIQINLKTMNAPKYQVTTPILPTQVYPLTYAYSLVYSGAGVSNESQKVIIETPVSLDMKDGYGYEFYTLDKFPENYSINLYRMIYDETGDKNYGFELVQSTSDFTKIEDTKIKLPF